MQQNVIGKRVNVLDKGWIELLDFMPHPATGVSGDMAIVNAARTSFLGDSKGEEKDKKLLFYLMKNRHSTPFEMAQFKFMLSAPVLTLWQLARHRTLSINSSSSRYLPFDGDQMYIPGSDMWRKQSKDNKQGSSDEVLSQNEQNEILDYLWDKEQDTMFWLKEQYECLDECHENKQLRGYIGNISDALVVYHQMGQTIYEAMLNAGAAKEQAKLFLPGWGAYFTWVISVDAHNLMHLLKLRLDGHAQYEIRVYAEAMYNEFFRYMLPWTAEAFEEYVLNSDEHKQKN